MEHKSPIINGDGTNSRDFTYIDNVIQNQAQTIAFYKKGLAGLLIELQGKVNSYLSKIDSIVENETSELFNFIENQLNYKVTPDFSKYTLENKISYLKEILNRPIRVCGMVKNEGEPGGGPFWIKDQILGERLILVIEAEAYQLDDELFSELLKFEIPKEVYFLPKFIETETGKIQRLQTLTLVS